jgi:hypothetical protein
MFHQRSGRLIISRNMETKTTTINGKQVTFLYGFATEINYAKFTKGDNIHTFVQETAKQLDALVKGKAQVLPDVEKCIYLILAAAIAYSTSKGEKEPPITADDLMFTNDPTELYTALAQIVLLYGAFYKLLPGDVKEQEQKGTKGKNS